MDLFIYFKFISGLILAQHVPPCWCMHQPNVLILIYLRLWGITCERLNISRLFLELLKWSEIICMGNYYISISKEFTLFLAAVCVGVWRYLQFDCVGAKDLFKCYRLGVSTLCACSSLTRQRILQFESTVELCGLKVPQMFSTANMDPGIQRVGCHRRWCIMGYKRGVQV